MTPSGESSSEWPTLDALQMRALSRVLLELAQVGAGPVHVSSDGDVTIWPRESSGQWVAVIGQDGDVHCLDGTGWAVRR